MKYKSNKKEKGFTLTEVLVVVIIAGVLAAIALPLFTGSIEKTKSAHAVDMLSHIAKAQVAYNVKRGQYTDNVLSLPLDLSQDGQYGSATANGQEFSDEYFNYTVYGDDLKKAIAERKTGAYELEIDYPTGNIICHSERNKCALLRIPTSRRETTPDVEVTVQNSIILDPVPARMACHTGYLQRYGGDWGNSVVPGNFCQYRTNESGTIEFIDCQENICTKRTLDKNGRLLMQEGCEDGNWNSNYECVGTHTTYAKTNDIYDSSGRLIACRAASSSEYSAGSRETCASAIGNYNLRSSLYETDENGRIIQERNCLVMKNDGTCTSYGNKLYEYEYDKYGNVTKDIVKNCPSTNKDPESCETISWTNYRDYSDPESSIPDRRVTCTGDSVDGCTAWEYTKDGNDNITLVTICNNYNYGTKTCEGGYWESNFYRANFDDQGNILSVDLVHVNSDGNIDEKKPAYEYSTEEDGSFTIKDLINGTCQRYSYGKPPVDC